MENLLLGFSVTITPHNLALALIGCVIGMLVGVLPGIGTSASIGLLLPVTYYLPPVGAIIMLASIFYGASYGGRITSILLNVPGEGEAVVTAFDGYPMAMQGRSGPALTITAVASFFGGMVGTVVVFMAAAPLSSIATHMTSAAYFSVMVFGLCAIAGLSQGSVLKALISTVVGLLLAQVGTDPFVGAPRFTFGQAALLDGLPLVAVIIAYAGISDLLRLSRHECGCSGRSFVWELEFDGAAGEHD